MKNQISETAVQMSHLIGFLGGVEAAARSAVKVIAIDTDEYTDLKNSLNALDRFMDRSTL